jgi:hypothetical protein
MSFSSDNPLVANQIGDFDVPETFEEFSDIFERNYKKVADAMNTKETGLYLLQESATFQQYFKANDPQGNRNIYRKVINFGRLPNATSRRVPHNININSNFRLTRLYGATNDVGSLSFLPLPFASPTDADNIALEIDNRDVIITTGADRSSYTETTVVLEYSKSG